MIHKDQKNSQVLNRQVNKLNSRKIILVHQRKINTFQP